MSKNRDLIYDMAEAPETEDFEQLDSEPLQLGGVGEDAPAANDRQVTTPGDVHVAPTFILYGEPPGLVILLAHPTSWSFRPT